MPVPTSTRHGSSNSTCTIKTSPANHILPPSSSQIPPQIPEHGDWEEKRERISRDATAIFGTATGVCHEALHMSIDILSVAPVAGLGDAARTLLCIWDAFQRVETNRSSCLRLTKRCAEILRSVYHEVQDAGDSVREILQMPINELVASLNQVHMFLEKQGTQPFLKRYLKRVEILKQIEAHEGRLAVVLALFSCSIQTRILSEVITADQQSVDDHQLLSYALNSRFNSCTLGNGVGLGIDTASTTSAVKQSTAPHPSPAVIPSSILSSNRTLTADEIQTTLATMHAFQAKEDVVRDATQIRDLMKMTLNKNSDAEIIEALQVRRDEMPEAIKTLQRALEKVVDVNDQKTGGDLGTVVDASRARAKIVRRFSKTMTVIPKATDSGQTTGVHGEGTDTLDREFMETGLDALRRMSQGVDYTLPSWTITKYEVECDEEIGHGFFSTVNKGTWRSRTVAVKILAPITSRKLFVKEVEIWKSLKHPHVLELYGASSTSGNPPWFFVSPFEKNGSLVHHLKTVKAQGGEVDQIRMMLEVAKGMEYLHSKDVVHGDLKAANVLVDDWMHCVIADFGQSEMRSEVSRISGITPSGTLRWQAPELMEGRAKLSLEVDVYAYAISCIEILTMGDLPWNGADDSSIIHFVLKENKRPSIPYARATSQDLQSLIERSWDRDPSSRPAFSVIVQEFKQLRNNAGIKDDICSPPLMDSWPVSISRSRLSPDIRPINSPGSNGFATFGISPSPPSDTSSYKTADGSSIFSKTEDVVPTKGIHLPESIYQTFNNHDRPSSFMSTPSTQSEENLVDHERIAEMRNERRYRMLLTHKFNPSLMLPLWSPSPIPVGAVGYLSKPSGSFIQLFNSLAPKGTPAPAGMPSLSGYGRVSEGNQRHDTRNVAKRGLDVITGRLASKPKGDDPSLQSVSRKESWPLRAGQKCAYLYTESTSYRYMEDLETPKEWFKANIDTIVDTFGPQHRIQKEDIFLVIGTLATPDHALFVSHDHGNGHVRFNVFSAPRPGQPWGRFVTDTGVASERRPSYQEAVTSDVLAANKVSVTGGGWNTVLISRLRFKPDLLEPTLL